MDKKLFSKDFSLVVIGQIISILGSAMLRFSLDLYVLDITGRADVFALVLALSAIPAIVFSPIGGAIADRFNRRNLMVIFDFCSSAVVLLLLLLLGIGKPPIFMIVVILSSLSLIGAVYQPTVQASVPILVVEQQLATANGIVSGIGALSGLIGPVLGGILYGSIGLKPLVLISCIAFFLSAVMEIFIHIPFKKQELHKKIIPTIFDDLKVGINYVSKENPIILRIILLAAVLNLFMTPFFIIGIPYILRFVMHSNDTMYGIGLGIGELSTVIGALTVGVFTKNTTINRLYKLIAFSSLLILPMAIAVMPIVLHLGYWVSFAMFFIFGSAIMMIITMISVFVITSVQKETPNELLGKVMAIIMAVAQCVAPLGQILYGSMFEHFNSKVYIPVFISFSFTVGIAVLAKVALNKHSK